MQVNIFFSWQSKLWSVVFLSTFFFSCQKKEKTFDASGTFEAIETVISAQAGGQILSFNIKEGQALQAATIVGYIDSVGLSLKKEQLTAQMKAILSKKPNISSQLAALNQQLLTAKKEQKRFKNLVEAGAVPKKQLDDANAQVAYLEKQISVQKSIMKQSSSSLNKETEPLKIQKEQLSDQLRKNVIVNPIEGTVLAKYAEQFELAVPGKALYKIADLSHLILRVYLTNDQLAQVRLNQMVTVQTDDGKGVFKDTKGKIIWISDKAEFTPKTIQTKAERANLVYAVKVDVPNDGYLKIGMYGQIIFDK